MYTYDYVRMTIYITMYIVYQGFRFDTRGKLRNPILGNIQIRLSKEIYIIDFDIEEPTFLY